MRFLGAVALISAVAVAPAAGAAVERAYGMGAAVDPVRAPLPETARGCEPAVPGWSLVAPEQPPRIETWSPKSVDPLRLAPACSDWPLAEEAISVALEASVSGIRDAEDVLERFGAISALAQVRYWSVTDKSWRALVTHAAALTGADSRQKRADFSADELRGGAQCFYAQGDNLSSSDVVYRLRILEASENRIVIATENISAVKLFLFTVLHPRDLQSIYILQRQSADVWRYYNLTRVASSSWLHAGHEASYVNRVAAQYRHIARIAMDQVPPAAP